MLLVRHVNSTVVHGDIEYTPAICVLIHTHNHIVSSACFILHQIRWMMPTSGIVPIPCAAATEGVVQLPADSKHPSKLLGAWACRAARRKVLEHACGSAQITIVALLLSPANAAASPPMSMEATSPSPSLGKLSPPPAARRSPPRVEVEALGKLSPPPAACKSPPWVEVEARSWQCHLCTYKHDFVTGSRTFVMYHLKRRRSHCAPQHVGKSKLGVRTRGSGKLDCPNCRLTERCKACLLACREKCINDTWIDAKGPLK